MSQVDYRGVYRIDSGKHSLDSKTLFGANFHLDEVVDRAMRKPTKNNRYKLHRRGLTEKVKFSTDKYNDPSSEILILSLYEKGWSIFGKKTKPIVALRYQAVKKTGHNDYGIKWSEFPDWNNDPENFLGICYVQTMTGVDQKDYKKATEVLGSRPHEFLVAHFLSRVAPIVDAQPETKVVLQPSLLTSRKTIRDRFFGKNWQLSPDKERVKQILGHDNAWLKAEAREARLDKT